MKTGNITVCKFEGVLSVLHQLWVLLVGESEQGRIPGTSAHWSVFSLVRTPCVILAAETKISMTVISTYRQQQ